MPAKHSIQLTSLFAPWAAVDRAAQPSPGSLTQGGAPSCPIRVWFPNRAGRSCSLGHPWPLTPHPGMVAATRAVCRDLGRVRPLAHLGWNITGSLFTRRECHDLEEEQPGQPGLGIPD